VSEWNRLKHHIEAALHRGGDTLTIEDVEARIRSGQYTFWPGIDSAVVTQVIIGSTETELNILLAGGTLSELEKMMPHLENYGRDMGCSLVTVLGRLGWDRSFLTKRLGYKPVALLIGKRL
jgi:hypothetical protein